MLLGTLGAVFLENLWAGKSLIRAVKATIRAGPGFLMPPHYLVILKQICYQKGCRFNGVYWSK